MFGERLNQVRHMQGYSASQVAEQVHVELRSYRKYESGHRYPSYELLVRIADYLDVSLDYLLCRDEFIEKNRNKEK